MRPALLNIKSSRRRRWSHKLTYWMDIQPVIALHNELKQGTWALNWWSSLRMHWHGCEWTFIVPFPIWRGLFCFMGILTGIELPVQQSVGVCRNLILNCSQQQIGLSFTSDRTLNINWIEKFRGFLFRLLKGRYLKMEINLPTIVLCWQMTAIVLKSSHVLLFCFPILGFQRINRQLTLFIVSVLITQNHSQVHALWILSDNILVSST